MALPHTLTNGTLPDADPVMDNFNYLITKAVPVGTVVAWLKSATGTPALPAEWVECNGQILSDAGSVYNGQTIPDLNGGNRFLRGSATSGTTGGAETHTHSLDIFDYVGNGATQRYVSSANTVSSSSSLPPYYEVVWIMKIK